MKKTLPLLTIALSFLGFTSCLKDAATTQCTTKTVQSDQPEMAVFAGANGISYTQDPSGLFYQITNQGTGDSPTGLSRIFVTYTSKLVRNGIVFDSQADPDHTGWTLNTLIGGWQIGLPLLKKGGTIKLIVPSALGYGCRGYMAVPPDAVLYFEITLVDFI